MPPSTKLLTCLSFILIVTYAGLLYIGLYLPLQTDEIGWIFLNDRAVVDGYSLIGLLPQCGKDVFSRPVPWLWMIPAWFNYLTYAQIDNPVWIRVAGMMQFLVWLSLWFAIAVKLFAVPRGRWPVALGLLLAFLGMDALPLLFVVNRPEQVLTIGTGLFIALALYAERFTAGMAKKTAGTALFFFAALYVHATHPKAGALLPLELATGGFFLQAVWRRRMATLAGLAAIAWIGVASYGFQLWRIECPGSEIVRTDWKELSLPISLVFTQPLSFIRQASYNFILSLLTVLFLHPYLDVDHDYLTWIPLSLQPLGGAAYEVVFALEVAAWLFYLGCFGYAALAAMGHIKAWIGGSRDAPLPALALCAVMAAMFAYFTFTGVLQMFYATGLNIPLVLLAALFAFRLARKGAMPRGGALYAALLLACAIASQCLLIDRYRAFASDPAGHETVIPNRKITTSPWNYGQKRQAILELAGQCHIDARNGRHVVVDDTTYHALRHTYQPLHITYSTQLHSRDVRKNFDPMAYFALLNAYDSDGVLAECANFLDQLRPYAIEHEGFCCIPKDRLQSVNITW